MNSNLWRSTPATVPVGLFDVDQAIRAALNLHQNGRETEAADIYRQILQIQPKHFDALYLLAVVHHESGDNLSAVPLLTAALEILPRHPDALTTLAQVQYLLNQPIYALAHAEAALAIRPDARACNVRAQALLALGQHNSALSGTESAIKLAPNFASAYVTRGDVLCALNLHDQALACYFKATELNFANRRFEDAISNLDLALTINPDNADIYLTRGNARLQLGQSKAAICDYDRAIAIRPDAHMAYSMRSSALQSLGRFEEAFESINHAIALDSNNFEYYWLRANNHSFQRNINEALSDYDRALKINPNCAESNYNQSVLLLTKGDFASGWSKYEFRIKSRSYTSPARNFNIPRLNSLDSIAGKTILIHAEQGFGDTLQFYRYAPLLAAKKANVVLEVQPQLKSLLAFQTDTIQVIANGETIPPCHAHCPIMSLPFVFKTNAIEDIPSAVPYIQAEPSKQAVWKKRLGDKSHKLRIGISWSGRPENENIRSRRLPLSIIRQALCEESIEFVCIQKDVREDDRMELSSSSIRDYRDQLEDFSDTAALIAQMDLVISIDTALAHLAGALGKPVWILLPYLSDWRWLLDRSDNPWYPSAYLLRQTINGNWKNVISMLQQDINALTEIGSDDPQEILSFTQALTKRHRS